MVLIIIEFLTYYISGEKRGRGQNQPWQTDSADAYFVVLQITLESTVNTPYTYIYI